MYRISRRVTWLILLLIAGVALPHHFFPVGCEAGPAAPGRALHHAYIPHFSAAPKPTPQPWSWLDYLNRYRAASGLVPLVEVPEWSEGAWLHARYMVKNDVTQHSEDQDNPWYTPAGEAAAKASNLIGTSHLLETSDRWALDIWLAGPFHAVGILDPQFLRSGFGTYREADGGVQMGAALDVVRGSGALPSATRYPILWPAPGVELPFRQHWAEQPNPLTGCPGYTHPAGPVVILQAGPGDGVPAVGDHAFTRNGVPLEHCVFSESSYLNPDAYGQSLGRYLLDIRDAVVLIPRRPLDPGATYTVSLTVNGRHSRWSFSVDESAS